MPEQIHLDEEAFNMMKEVMEDEFDLLLETFIEDMHVKVDGLKSALDAQNLQSFSETCHSLKGSASNMGLPELRALSARGEVAGREGSLQECQELLQALQSESEVVLALLNDVA